MLSGPVGYEYVNQGGLDIGALGRKDLSDETYIVGNVEFLSHYVYRLVFDDNYSQAVSSEVSSVIGMTHAHNGFIPSASLPAQPTATKPGFCIFPTFATTYSIAHCVPRHSIGA